MYLKSREEHEGDVIKNIFSRNLLHHGSVFLLKWPEFEDNSKIHGGQYNHLLILMLTILNFLHFAVAIFGGRDLPVNTAGHQTGTEHYHRDGGVPV